MLNKTAKQGRNQKAGRPTGFSDLKMSALRLTFEGCAGVRPCTTFKFST